MDSWGAVNVTSAKHWHASDILCLHAGQMGGVYQAMLILWGSKQSLSRGIRESKMDISRVRECRLCRLGAVLGRKIRVDSKTQDPGEFCQTRLQDTDTLSQTKQSCSYALVHILAYFWEDDECVHKTKCRCGKGESNSKGQNLHCLWVVHRCVCVYTRGEHGTCSMHKLGSV